MQVQTSLLKDSALNWAVATALGLPVVLTAQGACVLPDSESPAALPSRFDPVTLWEQAGPILERERISFAYEPSLLYDDSARWKALCAMSDAEHEYGASPLEASMRCMVAVKLGSVVNLPQDLSQGYPCADNLLV